MISSVRSFFKCIVGATSGNMFRAALFRMLETLYCTHYSIMFPYSLLCSSLRCALSNASPLQERSARLPNILTLIKQLDSFWKSVILTPNLKFKGYDGERWVCKTISSISSDNVESALSYTWNLSEAGRLPTAAIINPPRPGAYELPSEAYGMEKQQI